MRITGGTVRGRKLAGLKGSEGKIRPTSDRVREAIFNILQKKTCDAKVLDLFAGTGALGIEALSRGAQFSCFVDNSKYSCQTIYTNLTSCFSNPQAVILPLQLPITGFQKKLIAKLGQTIAFDLIFLDPPYRQNLVTSTLEMIEAENLLASDGVIMVEEHSSLTFPETTKTLKLTDYRKYGETGLWTFVHNPQADQVNQ